MLRNPSDKGVTTSVQGKIMYAELGNANYGETKSRFLPLEEGQIISSGSVISSWKDGGVARVNLPGNNKLLVFDYTEVGIAGLNVTQSGTNRIAEISLDLSAGSIQGELTMGSLVVKTPLAFFVVPETSATKFQISANGVAHAIEGSLAVAYIDPITWKLSTYTLNAGETFFVPPVGGVGIHPVIRPTRDGEVLSEHPVLEPTK
jgi:hypothetical protein